MAGVCMVATRTSYPVMAGVFDVREGRYGSNENLLPLSFK